MWRLARSEDTPRIAAMCRSLYIEDPEPGAGAEPGGAHILQTLAELRDNPVRGRAVVLELDQKVSGYALLISYWSNEFSGEFCTIDELFVEAELRGKGLASQLIQTLQRPQCPLWPGRIAGLDVHAYQTNPRAKALYEKLGFEVNTNHHLVYLAPAQ